jgi:hypothetical protein
LSWTYRDRQADPRVRGLAWVAVAAIFLAMVLVHAAPVESIVFAAIGAPILVLGLVVPSLPAWAESDAALQRVGRVCSRVGQVATGVLLLALFVR